MIIAIGCDHTALSLKDEVIQHLETLGHEVIDKGTYSKDRTHYPKYADLVCKSIQNSESQQGILICGTGVGMSIAANKHKDIRAVVCSEPYSAKASKQHNDSNVLCFGARVVGVELAKEIVDAFLNAEYDGGRHQTRVDMLNKLDL
jgi:ribose 5-phosphate isomerase B